MAFRSFFSHLDALDWILAIVFTLLLTGIGWLIQSSYGWIIGLTAAPVLLALAKSRRDEARQAKPQDEPPSK